MSNGGANHSSYEAGVGERSERGETHHTASLCAADHSSEAVNEFDAGCMASFPANFHARSLGDYFRLSFELINFFRLSRFDGRYLPVRRKLLLEIVPARREIHELWRTAVARSQHLVVFIAKPPDRPAAVEIRNRLGLSTCGIDDGTHQQRVKIFPGSVDEMPTRRHRQLPTQSTMPVPESHDTPLSGLPHRKHGIPRFGPDKHRRVRRSTVDVVLHISEGKSLNGYSTRDIVVPDPAPGRGFRTSFLLLFHKFGFGWDFQVHR